MDIKPSRFLSASVFAAGLLLSSLSFAQCITTTTANAGKNITVTATLHTSDPNENGEGEPLQVTSSDGKLNAPVAGYEIPYTFKFVSAQPNVSITGTINGADGDEGCELSVSASRFSQATKDSLTKIAAGLATTSGALWTYDALCSAGVITAAACNAIIGVGAASTSLLTGLAASLLAIDPVDLNYTQIPIPIPATLKPIVPGGNVTPQLAAAMNALLTNETAMMGYMRAMIQAINRASTAEAANDVIWPARQLQALASFQLSLGDLLTAEADLRQSLVTAMLAAGIGPVTITSAQALQTEAQIAGGWSAHQLQLLQSFGVSSDIIELARRITYVQNIADIAGSYPAKLADPALLKTLQLAGAAAQDFKVLIRPRKENPRVNVRSNHIIAVAVLGSATFDVRTIDILSARFGPNAIPQSRIASYMDVNKDKILDVVFYFRVRDSGIKCGDSSAVLTLITTDGSPLVGKGTIETVGCGREPEPEDDDD